MKAPDPQETVDQLAPMARSLAFNLRDHLHQFPDGDTNAAKQFYGVDARPPTSAWSGDRRITWRWPGGAEITFFDLDVIPPTPEDVTVTLEPEGQSEILDSLVRTTENPSPVNLHRKLTFADTESESSSSRDAGMQEVTAALELGMRARVGVSAGGEIYGGSIEAETELTSKLSAGYRQAWERATESMKSNEASTGSDWEFDILAGHKSVFTSIVEVSPMRQTTLARGRLKFGIIAHAPGHWIFNWPNRRALLANLRGIPTPDQHGKQVMLRKDIYQAHPVPNAEKLAIFDDAWAEVEHSRLIRASKKFDTRFDMVPMNDEARLANAIQLISLHGPADLKAVALEYLAVKG